jgi:hypothetical protein
MTSNWLDRVGSVIPRGFSRHYVLTSIREAPMAGKEIIDKAIAESGLLRLGSAGRFMTLDLLDRISNIGNALSSNLDKMT